MRTTTNPQSTDKSKARDAATQITLGKGGNPERKTRETKAEKRLRRGAISVEQWLRLMA